MISEAVAEVDEAKYNLGYWTDDEHAKFLDALLIHGKDWDKIQAHVGTRDAAHIRSHAQKFFRKLVRYLQGRKKGLKIDKAEVYMEILQQKVEKPNKKKTKVNPNMEICEEPDLKEDEEELQRLFVVHKDPQAVQRQQAIKNVTPS